MPNVLLAPARWRAARVTGLICGITMAAAASGQQLSHAPDPLFHDGFAGVAAGPFTDSDASRFLAQATFGPTDADIAHLRAVGYQAWLNEQFAAIPTYEVTDIPPPPSPPTQQAYLNWTQNVLGERVGQENRQEAWFLGALGGPDPKNNVIIHSDQLRQRVAFALSEILVISDNNPTLDGWPRGMAYYYDILTKNAFGNYRVLLEQVTLSPAMGVYLNMMGNRRADLSQNLHPDENYGREINQLFSVGLVMLNLDGTPKSPTTPTYTQGTITNFAHVLTGWNWATCDANGYDNFVGCFTPYTTEADFETPMVPYETKPPNENCPTCDYNYHDNGTHTDDTHNKQLLSYTGAVNGGVLTDGGTATSDLAFALDNIFNHPNVGPFISKELIQRLVTSNPSPAYVQRVATVFNNNGSNVRGDLKAVVQAILLDPEARTGQWHNPDTFGKLREPLLTLTHFWRAMGARHVCGNDLSTPNDPNPPIVTKYANQPYRYAGYGSAWNTNDTQYGSGVAQASLDAFTVFNFFKPGFVPSGEMTTRGLLGPEFQLQTDSIIVNSTNTTGYHAFYYDINDYYDPVGHPGVHCDPTDDFGSVSVNHAQDIALAGSGTGGSSAGLVDAYSKRFMSGQMSPFMRQTLISYLDTIDNSSVGSDWQLQRIYRALYLIFNSPEYMIQK